MNTSKEYRWVKVAESLSALTFVENNLLGIEVEDKRICLVKTSSGLKACSSKCPHAGGNLIDGKLDAKENIVCCVHHYHFNLSNGRDTLGEGYFLKIYPTRIDETGVYVGL